MTFLESGFGELLATVATMVTKLWAIVSAVTVCALLAGCTPATRGGVALAVSADGRPVAVFAPCEGDITVVTLSVVDEIGLRIAQVQQWRYEQGDAPTEFVIDDELPELAAEQRYQISGGAMHDAWPRPEYKILEPTWFTRDDLSRLTVERVLYRYFDGESFVTTTSSRARFEATACESP